MCTSSCDHLLTIIGSHFPTYHQVPFAESTALRWLDRGTLIAAEQIVEIRTAEAERIRNLVPRTRLCIAVEGVSLHPKRRAGGKKANLTKQASKAAAKGKAKARAKAKKIAWEQKGVVGGQAKGKTNGETKGETKEADG